MTAAPARRNASGRSAVALAAALLLAGGAAEAGVVKVPISLPLPARLDTSFLSAGSEIRIASVQTGAP